MMAIASVSSERLERKGQSSEAPNSFDQLLYRAVAIEGYSAAGASTAFGVPRERIVENHDRVHQWLAETRKPTGLPPAAQREAIERQAIDRLEYLYSEATEAWRQSQKQGVTRTPMLAPSKRMTMLQTGNCQASILHYAARIVILVSRYQLQCLAEREKAEQEAASTKENSPIRDCSRTSGEQVAEVAFTDDGHDTGHCWTSTSDDSIGEP